jgi:hypothetical protein
MIQPQSATTYPAANICSVTDYGNAQTRRAAEAVGATAFVLNENLAELCKLFATSSPRKPEARIKL